MVENDAEDEHFSSEFTFGAAPISSYCGVMVIAPNLCKTAASLCWQSQSK